VTTTLGATHNPKLVEVPERTLPMVGGRGDPNGSEEFRRAIGTPYAVSYGRHHEIYLSDLRRTAPDRLRTVLRQPVAA
jgi:hypothetical protein